MPKALLLLAILSIASNTAMADNGNKERAMKSKAVVKEFMGQLKGELQKAMKAGGPIKAIKVCNEKAPEIADTLSKKYGWSIARTSLKTRNPQNSPDARETKVLNDFEARKTKGEDVKPMAYFEVVEDSKGKSFRFMKAIPTGEVCLKCHGDNIAPEVTAQLDKFYPEDKARGFKKGDIRGAFTFKQPM